MVSGGHQGFETGSFLQAKTLEFMKRTGIVAKFGTKLAKGVPLMGGAMNQAQQLIVRLRETRWCFRRNRGFIAGRFGAIVLGKTKVRRKRLAFPWAQRVKSKFERNTKSRNAFGVLRTVVFCI